VAGFTKEAEESNPSAGGAGAAEGGLGEVALNSGFGLTTVMGVAKRVCISCSSEHFICDSKEFWSDATPEEWQCVECGSKAANVGVGFSLYEEGEVHWLYVGERCSSCGVLGCFAGWKVGHAPSRQLMDQV
jgi:hypothetical protein